MNGSAANLHEAQDALLRKRTLLQAELRALSGEAPAQVVSAAHAGDEPGDWVDIAQHYIEGGVVESVRRRLYEGLADVEAALARLEANTYTRCEECGGEIEPARLEALPSARRCLQCQTRVEARRR